MVIDISAHLRRLVLAGLPLVGGGAAGAVLAGCQTGAGGPPPTSTATAKQCTPRTLVPRREGGQNTRLVDVGFAADDPRLADLYESCVGAGDYCGRLCQEALKHAGISVASGHQLSAPMSCELRCDDGGGPVARIEYFTFSTAAIGRRPAGFTGAASAAPGTTGGTIVEAVGSAGAARARVAAFFAGCAELEGASVTAFAILADELALHGAPPALVARARAAAGDEARHWRQTRRLARRFGAAAARFPRPARPAPRPLEVVARENALEGCVNETFAAALALWQGGRAGDAEVRATMAAIAEDELAHAQLAWDVHRWAVRRLPAAVAGELAEVQAEAGRALARHHAEAPVDPALSATAGLPGCAQAGWLAGAAQGLWA
jgi:hypothetical protein